MTVFEAVKQISCNDAAQRLGLKGKRGSAGRGTWCCPFHDDHRPSMACFDRDNRFYCFTCHASGDAANLFARVRGLSPVEAARAALTEFGLEIPGACDRPRKDAAIIRQEVVERCAALIREAYREGMVLLLASQAEGMTAAMDKAPDTEGWLWAHALQRACRVQEESARWQGMTDEDVQQEITQALRAGQEPRWGEGLPTPGRALFRAIMDELERRMSSFPKLNLCEQKAVLDALCAV